MRPFFCYCLLGLWSLVLIQPAGAELSVTDRDPGLAERAEALFEAGSFALALPLFEAALEQVDSASPQRDWLQFRVADTRWRTVAGDDPLQRDILVAARDELIALAAEVEREARGLRPPRLWARIMEAIGDSWWRSPAQTNLQAAWQYYERALNWWAGSTDVDRARAAYLRMVWRISDLPQFGVGGPPRHRGWSPVPVQVYVNALRIATDPEDRARAAYLLAVSRTGSRDQAEVGRLLARVVGELEGTEWYGSLVFAYARWLETVGSVSYDRDGNLVQQPDYVAAVEWYERFLELDEAATSPHYREVNDRLGVLRSVQLGIAVRNTFLPQAPLTIDLSWRNIDAVEVKLVRLDMSREFTWTDTGGAWYEHLSLDRHNVLRTLTESAGGGHYAPERRKLEVADGLPAGLYVVEAVAGEQRARDFLIVSSSVLSGLREDNSGVFYLADGFSGRHLSGGRLMTFERVFRRGEGYGPWSVQRHQAAADGLFRVDLSGDGRRQVELFGEADGLPAYGGGFTLFESRQGGATASWTVYGYSDRSAYRPGETAHWKLVSRLLEGSEYTVPTGRRVRVDILNANGDVVAQSEHRLSGFGSAWGDFDIPSHANLGLYQMAVYDLEARRTPRIATVSLLRVEEYRLPEYRVAVSARRLDGDGVILLGDTVEGLVEVEYYAGGGVPGAEVELQVHRRQVHIPFYGRPAPLGMDRRGVRGPGSGHEGFVLQEALVTDADGRVTFQFPTDAFGGTNVEFVISASVADQSRQVVAAEESIRVSTQAYQAKVESSRYLGRPQVPMDLRVRLTDPADEPVVASGRLRVYRNEWRSYWRGTQGRTVSGAEWRSIQANAGFRPADWTFVREGWVREEVALFELETAADGRASVMFTPTQPGSYSLEWVSVPKRGAPVRADAGFWVADESTRVLNIQPGYNLIYDEDSFRIGESVSVMVTTPQPNQAVLISVIGEGFLASKLVHVGGGPRLVRFDVDRLWAPNATLHMVAVADFSLHADRREIEVPNTPNRITIETVGLAASYRPGDDVTLELVATDYTGQPLVTELSLAVFDESVRAIQGDLAADPMDTFFPPRGRNRGTVMSSLMQGRPIVRQEKEEVDDEVVAAEAVPQRGEAMMVGARAMSVDAVAFSGSPEAPTATADKAVDLASVALRADFRTTAFWAPDLVTAEDGRVKVSFRLPDDLTQWAVVGRGVDRDDRFGQGEDEFRTSLPLLVRLATPRYWVAGDSGIIRSILRNNTAEPIGIRSRLDASGSLLLRTDEGEELTGTIGSGAELSGDWRIAAVDPGAGKIEVRVVADDGLSDGLERTIPVVGNGIPAQVAFRGGLGDPAAGTIRFAVPEFAAGSQRGTLYLSASPVAAIFPAASNLVKQANSENSVDAIINRVFPLAVVASLAEAHSVPLAKLVGDVDFAATVQSNLELLAARQRPSGGWSWYPGGPEDLYMSAYAVWGLAAFPADYPLRDEIAAKAKAFLDQRVIELDGNINLQSWVLHALAAEEARTDGRPSRNGVRAFTNLWRNRDRLTVYGRALLTLTAHYFEFADEVKILAENLHNGLTWVNDREGGSRSAAESLAYWPTGERSWRWHGSTVESTAFAMKALAWVGNDAAIVEAAARWLLLNRRGAAWKDSRQSAVAIHALAGTVADGSYSEVSGAFSFALNGVPVGEVSYAAGEAALFTGTLEIDPALIAVGESELTVTRSAGDGPLFSSGVIRYFSAEHPVVAAGQLSTIRRRTWAIDPVPTLLRGYIPRYRFIARDDARVPVGSRLETVLIFSVDSDIDYLRIIDPRAAGLEATDPNSGYRYTVVQLDSVTARLLADGELNPDQAVQRADVIGTGRKGGYFQWRDSGLEINLESLATGTWMIRYSHRAEFPGSYSWLPAQLNAVYVEQLSANGNGVVLTIAE